MTSWAKQVLVVAVLVATVAMLSAASASGAPRAAQQVSRQPASASVVGRQKVEKARVGSVLVTLSYRRVRDRYGFFLFKDVRLRIVRDGAVELAKKLSPACRGCSLQPFGAFGGSSLRARDVDQDGEAELFVSFYSGGAHCCHYSLVYDYDLTKGRYLRTMKWWGGASPAFFEFRDFDGDELTEFEGVDDRFGYQFTSYAASAFPLQIWHFTTGRFTDVTRDYPSAVGDDAEQHWSQYLADRDQSYADMRGILAAWMADKYLLGQQQEAWDALDGARERGDLRGDGPSDPLRGQLYLDSLRAFLVKTGYAPAEPPACSDSKDNDSDSAVDFPADPGCSSAKDVSEVNAATQCSDAIDNDGDGKTDHPNDPGCSSSTDSSETTSAYQCDDGLDNDGDTTIDYPDDTGCASPIDTTEASGSPPPANCDSAYPTVCIPSPPPDLDCGDISYTNFTVLSPDPHRFDSDHDGIGCEGQQ